MKVQFVNNWFGPGMERFRKGIQKVPDEYFDSLPSTAKVERGGSFVSVKELRANPQPRRGRPPRSAEEQGQAPESE